MIKKTKNSDQYTFDDQLIDEAALKNSIYTYNKIEPSLFFWKQLVCSSPVNAPSILVPDTLILNEKDIEVMWIYSHPLTGKLSKEFNTNYKDFIMKITNYTSPNELVAILKRPVFQEQLGYVNEYKLFNSKSLQNSSQQQIVSQKNQVVCLQKYVKCSGSKAFICRTIYEKDKAACCYLLTNKHTAFYGSGGSQGKEQQNEFKRLITKASSKKETNCIKSKTGTNLEETLKYLKQITRFMHFVKGIQITELVGDFIKDESHNWWLINIKAFRIKQKICQVKAKQNLDSDLKTGFMCINKIEIVEQNNKLLQKERYQKTKVCRYCEKNYLEPELTHKLTMKMIIEVDKYLVHMGKWDKWLKRSDIANVDAHCLYQEHKVCERCYRLYSEIQALMKMEQKFLKRVGYNTENSPKEMIISQTNEEELWNQSKSKQIHRLSDGIPQVIELGPNTNITTIDNRPICNDEIINKMIRFRFIIFLNQIDQVVELGEGLSYFLELNILGRKTKYKLETSLLPSGSSSLNPVKSHPQTNKSCRNVNFSCSQPVNIIPLKKLKVIYFFANSLEEVEEYAKSGATIQINLMTESKKYSCFNKIESRNGGLGSSEVSTFSKKTFKESTVKAQNTSCQVDNVERKIIGKLNMQFKDLITFSANTTKKDFYKFFNVQGVSYGWGLEGSIGIIPSNGYVNTSRIIFSKVGKEIYLPNQNYYYCEYLPEQWINHIKAKHEQSKRHYTIKPHQSVMFGGMTSNRISSSMIKNSLSNSDMKKKNRKPSAFLQNENEENMLRELNRMERQGFQSEKDRKRVKYEEFEEKNENSESEGQIDWSRLLHQQIMNYEGRRVRKSHKNNNTKNKQNLRKLY